MKSSRLYCLDLLRGLDIFYLTVVWGILQACHRGLGLFSDGFMAQLDHTWGRFTFHDIVMPLFIFMCGAAVPLALKRRLTPEGRPAKGYWRHVFSRVALLWVLGMIAQGNLLTLDPMKIVPFDNTLQTIAVGYVIAAAALLVKRRWIRWSLPFLFAGVYSLALGLWGDYSPKGNLAQVADQWFADLFAPPASLAATLTRYTWYSTTPMFGVMTLLGMISTEILCDGGEDTSPYRRFGALALFGLAMLALGWALVPVIPSIKHIYTASFTFQAMGWSMTALALLYLVCDIWRFRRGLSLFILYGQFALVAYMLADTPLSGILESATKILSQGFPRWVGPAWTPVLAAVLQGVILTFVLLVRRALKRRTGDSPSKHKET